MSLVTICDTPCLKFSGVNFSDCIKLSPLPFRINLIDVLSWRCRDAPVILGQLRNHITYYRISRISSIDIIFSMFMISSYSLELNYFTSVPPITLFLSFHYIFWHIEMIATIIHLRAKIFILWICQWYIRGEGLVSLLYIIYFRWFRIRYCTISDYSQCIIAMTFLGHLL